MGRASKSQYAEMRKLYRDLDIRLINDEAEKTLRQLTRFIYREKSKRIGRKLKPKYPKIAWYSNRDSGCWYEWEWRIRLSNRPSIYVICHELAHMANDLKAWDQGSVIEAGTDHHGVRFQ